MRKNNIIIAGTVLVVLFLVIVFSQNSKTNKRDDTKNKNTNRTVVVPEFNFELLFDDKTITPKEFTTGLSQTIKVKLNNTGTVAHAFKFNTLDFNSGAVDPGTSKIVTFTTPSTAGQYDFFCDQADHKIKGETGTMIVQ